MRRNRQLPELIGLLRLVGVLAALAVPSAASLAAQRAPMPASPPLPPQHWAVQAAKRVHASGLADEYFPAQRSAPRDVVIQTLRDAAERAAAQRHPATGLVRAWIARFEEEFPEAARPISMRQTGAEMRGGYAGVGYRAHSGREAPGVGEVPPDRTGALPLPDERGAELSTAFALSLRPWLAAALEPGWSGEGLEIVSGDLVVAGRRFALAAGRQPVGYGFAEGGSVVLTGAARFDRVSLETVRPLRLPGPLRYLGDVAFHTFVTRFTEERHVGEPYFWGAAGTLRPHPRLAASVHAATTLGGGLDPQPITPRNVFYSITGNKKAGPFADQVVAVEFRLRLPTERVLPATLYLEWGAEDSAGAWRDVPAQVFGLYLPGLPALPQGALGVEYARFGPGCCGNPPWYRHNAHPGNWAFQDAVLGHPLGGEGREFLVFGRLDLLDARLRLDGRGFRRSRGAENLFVPGRERSTGFGVGGEWRLGPSSDLSLLFAQESGPSWTERRASSALRVFF